MTAQSTDLTNEQRTALLAHLRYVLGRNHACKALDVLQEAYLQTHKHREQFQGLRGAQWTTWFRTIAHNTALQLLRSERIRPQSLPEVSEEFTRAFEAIPDSALNPEERLLALERNRLLVKALLKLRPKRRRALLLNAVKTTGKGTDSDAAKALLFYGRRELRRLLKQRSFPNA